MARYHARVQADRAGQATYPIAQERGAATRRLGGGGLRLYRGTPFRRGFAQLLPAGRSVACGEGAAARAIRKDGLERGGVAFSPPFCYIDFNLLSYFDRLQPKCPIEFRLLGRL